MYEGAFNSDWIGKSIKQQKHVLFMIKRAQKAQALSVYENFMTSSSEFLMNVIFKYRNYVCFQVN